MFSEVKTHPCVFLHPLSPAITHIYAAAQTAYRCTTCLGVPSPVLFSSSLLHSDMLSYLLLSSSSSLSLCHAPPLYTLPLSAWPPTEKWENYLVFQLHFSFPSIYARSIFLPWFRSVSVQLCLLSPTLFLFLFLPSLLPLMSLFYDLNDISPTHRSAVPLYSCVCELFCHNGFILFN